MADQSADDWMINGDAIVESFRLSDLFDKALMERAELLARAAGTLGPGGKVLLKVEHLRQAFSELLPGH